MKKLLSLALLWFISTGAFAQIGLGSGVSGVPSTLNCAGGFCSTPCATNYARKGPNFCLRTAAFTASAINTTCTTIAAPAGALATSNTVRITMNGVSLVGTSERSTVTAYNDGTCTTAIASFTCASTDTLASPQITGACTVKIISPVISGNIFLLRVDV